MTRCRQWRFEHRKVFGARVPEEDLARVGASEDEIRVERGEGDGKDVGLHMRQKQISSQTSRLKYSGKKGKRT